MSFHDDLVADAVWPTDLKTALALASTAGITVGRQPQKVPRPGDLDVTIELREHKQRGTSAQRITEWVYRLHLAKTENAGPRIAGTTQVATLQAHVETLCDRYHGARVLTATLPTLVSMACELETFDEEPDDQGAQRAALRVSWFVKG